jgi:hypothetical protein
MIKLNRRVTDTLTGYSGTTVSRTQYQSGDDRYGVQARISKDGKVPPIEYFDESRLILETV